MVFFRRCCWSGGRRAFRRKAYLDAPRLLLLLSVVYVIGCGFRSRFLPMVDVPA
jgi:hypothetical protein